MAEASVKAKPDTVVLIHGLWMTPRSWEHWKERYEARGYTVHAPAWPGFEGEVEALNADPSPMTDLKAETVIDAYEAFINELRWRPDHHGSLPGRRDHPGAVEPRSRKRRAWGCPRRPSKGIRDLPWSTLRAAGPALNPFKRGKPVPISEKEFHYAFANTMSEEEAKPLYERYAVPAASLTCSLTSRSPTCTATRRRRWTSPSRVRSRCSSSCSGRPGPCWLPKATMQTEWNRTTRWFDHRVPRVRGSAALPGCSWLGGGGRLRDRLGRAPCGADGSRTCHCGRLQSPGADEAPSLKELR